MGLFGKLKNLTNAVSADKFKGIIDSVSPDDDKEKSVSGMDSPTDLEQSPENADASEVVENDEELKARQKERNKKIAKGFAKGAMFVGSFLYTQKCEGADAGSALEHAFKKSKDLDDLFDGKDKGGDKKKDESKEKEIKSIVHYEYICPQNMRGHNLEIPPIDVPTVYGNGCPTREEVLKVIMEVTGVDEARAHAIWNGGSNLHWRKVCYTYVNDGKLGSTVKC